MEFKLSFKMDNEAFSNYRGAEAARILYKIAHQVSNETIAGNIRDANGNRIGSFEIVED